MKNMDNHDMDNHDLSRYLLLFGKGASPYTNSRALLHDPVADAPAVFINSFKKMLKSKRDITVESFGKIDSVTYMCDYVALVLNDLITKYGTKCLVVDADNLFRTPPLLKKFLQDEACTAYGNIGMNEYEKGKLGVVIEEPVYSWNNGNKKRYEISLKLQGRHATQERNARAPYMYVVQLETDKIPYQEEVEDGFKKDIMASWPKAPSKNIQDATIAELVCKNVQVQLSEMSIAPTLYALPALKECYVADLQCEDMKKYYDMLFERRSKLRKNFLSFLQHACELKKKDLGGHALVNNKYIQDEDAKRMYEITNIFMNLSQPPDSNAIITLVDKDGFYQCHRFVNNVVCMNTVKEEEHVLFKEEHLGEVHVRRTCTMNTVTDAKYDNEYASLKNPGVSQYNEGKRSCSSSADKWETLLLPYFDYEHREYIDELDDILTEFEYHRLDAVLSAIRSKVGANPENVLNTPPWWWSSDAMVPLVLRKRYHLLENKNEISETSFLDFPLT